MSKLKLRVQDVCSFVPDVEGPDGNAQRMVVLLPDARNPLSLPDRNDTGNGGMVTLPAHYPYIKFHEAELEGRPPKDTAFVRTDPDGSYGYWFTNNVDLSLPSSNGPLRIENGFWENVVSLKSIYENTDDSGEIDPGLLVDQTLLGPSGIQNVLEGRVVTRLLLGSGIVSVGTGKGFLCEEHQFQTANGDSPDGLGERNLAHTVEINLDIEGPTVVIEARGFDGVKSDGLTLRPQSEDKPVEIWLGNTPLNLLLDWKFRPDDHTSRDFEIYHALLKRVPTQPLSPVAVAPPDVGDTGCCPCSRC